MELKKSWRPFFIVIFFFLGGNFIAVDAKKRPENGHFSRRQLKDKLYFLFWKWELNREADMLKAINDNDLNRFKELFIIEDLDVYPGLIEKIILNNKVEFIRCLDKDFDLDIKYVFDRNEQSKQQSQRNLVIHRLCEKYGSRAIAMKDCLKNIGFEINSKNSKGETLAHLAVGKKDSTLLRDLIAKNDIDINETDHNDQTPLYVAVALGNPGLVQEFIDVKKVANVALDASNNKGETPLHYAVRSNRLDIVEKLIAAGASVNVPNNEGSTPGHIAVREGNCPEIFRSLLEGDVDLLANNNNEESILEIIRNLEFEACVLLPKEVNQRSLQEHDKRCDYYSKLRVAVREDLLKKHTKELENRLEERKRKIEEQARFDREQVEERKNKFILKKQKLEQELEKTFEEGKRKIEEQTRIEQERILERKNKRNLKEQKFEYEMQKSEQEKQKQKKELTEDEELKNILLIQLAKKQ